MNILISLNAVLSLLNLSLAIINYYKENYKAAMFSSWAFGVNLMALFTLLFH